MTQNRFICPACERGFTSTQGVNLHFRQALTGWDPRWDPGQPHTRWARNKGINVTDEGYTFDFEKLKIILKEELSTQKQKIASNNDVIMDGLGSIITQLSCVGVNDSDHSRAGIVSGHLVKFVLQDQWNRLTERQRQSLIQPSTNRLWNSYMQIRKNTKKSTDDAAEIAISEELAYLKEILTP